MLFANFGVARAEDEPPKCKDTESSRKSVHLNAPMVRSVRHLAEALGATESRFVRFELAPRPKKLHAEVVVLDKE